MKLTLQQSSDGEPEGVVMLIIGTLERGFRFIGPFEDTSAVLLYVEESRDGIDWWPVELETPPLQFLPPELVKRYEKYSKQK